MLGTAYPRPSIETLNSPTANSRNFQERGNPMGFARTAFSDSKPPIPLRSSFNQGFSSTINSNRGEIMLSPNTKER